MSEKKLDDKVDDPLDSDLEESEIEISQEEKDNSLLQAARENNVEETIKWLNENGSPHFTKDGWNAILWAANNGNEEIIRKFIELDHMSAYKNIKEEKDETTKVDPEEENDPFVKPKDPKNNRYTPLHWASYKGHQRVVQILLKIGLDPLDKDMYGNTSVHQAAASGNLGVLKCFLARGVDVDLKNSRGHTPLDLTTASETKNLILKATKTKKC